MSKVRHGARWPFSPLLLMGVLFLFAACAPTNPPPPYPGGGGLGPYTGTNARIVVAPFYEEFGLHDAYARHYRRIVGFVSNQLVRHGFEVVNPWATALKEAEYDRYMERSREDSPYAARELCRRYATDLAYIVWLRVKARRTMDGFCKVRVRMEGEGYDSAGRDIGAAVSKTFVVTRRDCDDAVVEAEKEVADLVGRRLTAWSGRRSAPPGPGYSTGSAGFGGGRSPGGGGVLVRHSRALEGRIMVRLAGATEYELAEVFGKVLNTARGVVEAKRYRSRIVPDNPQASIAIWRVRIQGTDPFRLQANIMTMINKILDNGGEITLKGVPYRYTAAEVDLLKGIRSGDCSSREIQFVIDRERARDLEFEGIHDPYRPSRPAPRGSDQGFD